MFKAETAALGLALLIANPSLAQSGGSSSTPTTTAQTSGQDNAAEFTTKFDMFGVNAQQFYSGEVLISNKKCKLKGLGEEKCIYLTGPQISDVSIIKFGAFFNSGKLYILTGASSGANFRRVAEAFEAKYGKPFKVEDVEWKNRAGATFNNVKMTWVFGDGVLTLESRGYTMDEMRLIFVSDANSPKVAAPTVNF